MGDSCVLREDRGPIRILTLARTDRQNKLSIGLMDELYAALQQAEADESCRVVVLTNCGDYFCNGGDLGDYRTQSPVDIQRFGKSFITLHAGIVKLLKPVVAAVQGDVFNGGMSLLEACDLAVAADDVRFGTNEITLGIAPMMALAGVVRVRNHKGTMEMALLGDAMSARQALANGWVNRICPRSDVMTLAVEIAEQIAQRNPVAVTLCKKLYGEIAASQYEKQLKSGLNLLVALLKSEDAMEAVTAREENRQPVWLNR